MYEIVKSKENIKEGLKILADKINKDYQHVDALDIICFVNGASIFCSDLVKLLDISIRIHHFEFSSYPNLPSSGEIKIEQDIRHSLEGKHILLMEGLDISGKTPLYLLNLFKLRNPRSIKLCALGIKKENIEVDLEINYYIYNFEDEWIEG